MRWMLADTGRYTVRGDNIVFSIEWFACIKTGERE
jgi:hypothetical protein